MMERAIGDIEGVSRILGKGISITLNYLLGFFWDLFAWSEGERFDRFI